MSRVQLSINVSDFDAAVAFYSRLFGAATPSSGSGQVRQHKPTPTGCKPSPARAGSPSCACTALSNPGSSTPGDPERSSPTDTRDSPERPTGHRTALLPCRTADDAESLRVTAGPMPGAAERLRRQ